MEEVTQLWRWLPLIAIVGAFFLTSVLLGAYRVHWSRAGKRSPLAQDLARSPGESLRVRAADAVIDAAEYAALAAFALPLSVVVYATWWDAQETMPPTDILMVSLAAAAVLQLWVLWRLGRALGQARMLRLTYEAALAAGQELNELGGLGYRVFHDVSLKDRELYVDHVVVGPAGVFAVETRGRAKERLRSNGAAPWEVTYDGASLRFSWRKETKPLKQAIAQAGRVEQFLSRALGEPVPVQPVLALPGWSVRRTDVSGIAVLGGRRIQPYFEKVKPDPRMTGALALRVAAALEQRTRAAA